MSTEAWAVASFVVCWAAGSAIGLWLSFRVIIPFAERRGWL